MPYLEGRYWKRLLPVTGAPGMDLRSKAAELEAALSRHFLTEEGRGKSCGSSTTRARRCTSSTPIPRTMPPPH